MRYEHPTKFWKEVPLLYSWGVTQAFLSSRNVASVSTLAFVGSTTTVCVGGCAILSTHVIRYFGSRNAAILASALMTLGQLLSSWSTKSIAGLFVTNGLVLGIGSSLGFMVTGSLSAQYFKRRHSLANGIVYTGNGVGGCLFSLLNQALLARLGVEWMFRVVGLITLATTLPAAFFMQERPRRPAATIEWTLFRDPKFLLLFLGLAIATFPLIVPPFFIPLYASSIGISPSVGSALLAAFSLSSAVGRIGFGYLGDIVGPLNSLMLAFVVTSLCMLAMWPASASLAPFVAFIIINGLGNGGFFPTMPSVVGHVYGSTRLSTALGMIVSAWSAGYLLGAPVAGYILQLYGGNAAGRAAFRPAMYYAGSMSIGSASLILGARCLTTMNFFAWA
ncbi:hypothetical protein HYDPIDRAFT_145674 [Hydnomerulius pinastri MD-312]|nr:hypothetical protein HYDPIDRAFT_145674 [Hydnomerulius pinastri MD-312]